MIIVQMLSGKSSQWCVNSVVPPIGLLCQLLEKECRDL